MIFMLRSICCAAVIAVITSLQGMVSGQTGILAGALLAFAFGCFAYCSFVAADAIEAKRKAPARAGTRTSAKVIK